MRAKSAHKKVILSIILIIAVILVAVRIWYVNSKAYKFVTEEYSIGEWIPLEGNYFIDMDAENNDGYSVRISKAEVLPYEEFMSRFGKTADYLADYSRYDVILLTVDIKNEDNENGGVFIRDMNILTKSRSAYYNKNTDYMKIANPNISKTMDGVRVKPGTESTMYFVYPTDGQVDNITYLSALQKKNVKNFTMYVDVTRYPIKKTVRLDLTMPQQ